MNNTNLPIAKFPTIQKIVAKYKMTEAELTRQYRDTAFVMCAEFGAQKVELIRFVRVALMLRYPELLNNFSMAMEVLQDEKLI
jgi:hypothetical protein